MSTDLTDAKPAAVDELTRADFGMWVEIPGHGRGYLYAIHDDFNDGYPSRMVVLVADDGSTVAEMEFTDSDPAGYPKTMHTPCVVTDEPPEVRCPTCESPVSWAPVHADCPVTAPTGPDRTGVVARLDALEAAHKAATPGQWALEGFEILAPRHRLVAETGWRSDAAAIVAEHNAMPALLAAVRGVLAMDDEKTTRDLARAWLRHQGYTDEWIAVGEQQTHQSAGCEFDTNCMTWMCCDSLDCSLHPEMDSVEEAGYFARFAVDFLAEQTRATVTAALGEA